ncbi:MAG: sulfotransferase family protein [Solirubrobacterales bacterium]
MALQAIGAGLGRTGTQSVKAALERLLAGPCYDNHYLLENPEQVPVWERALGGHRVDWDTLFAEHRSAVDMTVAMFYAELAAAYPNALVILSTREPDAWWRSFDNTVVDALHKPVGDNPFAQALLPARDFTIRLLDARFTPEWTDEDAAKRAYERHNAAVRVTIPRSRLVEWQPGDDWSAICEGLGQPAPAEPFPHVNTTADFREMAGLDRER